MGCQISSSPKNVIGWSDLSWWVIKRCAPFVRKTGENFEFDNPYTPDIPTYQFGIDAEAARMALENLPEFPALSAEDRDMLRGKCLDESAYEQAKEFLSVSVSEKSHISVSY